MDFRNHTPFPALAFEGIDQFEQAFHVVVLRQTLTWGHDGMLVCSDEQAPLCEVDEYFGALNASSIRQESDLCHYKPKCDVIVNATAWMPPGVAQRRCAVRLVLKRPDAAAPMPPRPDGLNPFMAPDEGQLARWRAASQQALAHPLAGRRLIDKALTVTGERDLVRSAWPRRWLAGSLRIASLGLLDVATWRLTDATPFHHLPLRYEYAFGGECRINCGDAAARRVRKQYRLAGQAPADADAGEAAQQPIAHAAFEGNAVGRAYAPAWYLKACAITRLAAPRIELPVAPFRAARFGRSSASAKNGAGNGAAAAAAAAMAGLGVRPKVHPARRRLAGTVDRKFIESDAWLPMDFDFAVWNAAPLDQQIDFPRGDEIIELSNLCQAGAPGARIDSDGSTLLRLQLPGHSCHVLVRMQDGTMFFHAMQIDTLLVEPEHATVSVVWRCVLDKSAPIRALDARLHGAFEAGIGSALTAAADAVTGARHG